MDRNYPNHSGSNGGSKAPNSFPNATRSPYSYGQGQHISLLWCLQKFYLSSWKPGSFISSVSEGGGVPRTQNPSDYGHSYSLSQDNQPQLRPQGPEVPSQIRPAWGSVRDNSR